MNPTSRRPTIILSPLRGPYYANMDYVRRALFDSLSRGEAPFASHLIYPQVLNDSLPDERAQGLECELAWIRCAALGVFHDSKLLPLIAVYSDHGISVGMRETLAFIWKHYPTNFELEFRSIEPSLEPQN